MASTDQGYSTKDYARPLPSPAKSTPMTRLSGAVERLREVNSEASRLASKLVGDEVECTEAARKSRLPIGSGFLGSIEELADSVADLADDISENISRIERRI